MADIGKGPFGDDIPSVRGSAEALDAAYITSQLTRVYEAYGVAPTGPGTGATDIGYYTGVVIETGGWFNDGTREGNNAGYWYGRIGDDLRNAGQGGGTTGDGGGTGTGSAGGGVSFTSDALGLITPQLGLLEDDIGYRLALLTVNILQPLKDKYPNIVVVSGFRQTNSGIGQHELGEAVDLQIRNQTPQLLLEVADYIQKFLPFDQLILNHTRVGQGDSWIHVSFSPTSLREQVLTKDYDDTFYQGLFLAQPLAGEDAAQALRDQQTQDTQITSELQNLQTRQQRLNRTPGTSTSTGTSGTGDDTQTQDFDDAHKQVIQCVMDKMGPQFFPFEITKRVAWLLRDEGAGLLIKRDGINITPWQGYYFSNGRICYPDGRVFKVIDPAGDSDPYTLSGVYETTVDTSRYMPALDPGPGDWQTCTLNSGANT
jgi:hypothetical protein